MNKKLRAARLSVISNSLLILLKTVAGLLSGSVSILSEAIHSFMDLLASVIAFFSVRLSDTPADAQHPYGHGKIENVSGVAEALLILLAAGWIIYESINKMVHPGPVGSLEIGFIVMFFSAGVNLIVSRYLYKVAKETDSVALEADALHLKTDVYTSAGVALGLLLIWITGLHFLDPVIALIVAFLIIRESFGLLRKAWEPLLDSSIPAEEIDKIRRVLDSHCNQNISYHNLRTRKAGQFRYVDLHLTLDENLTVRQAHELCDTIENDIREILPRTEITIHVENF